jgi:hypothetical protein
MNRRNFLRTLAVVSAAGSSVNPLQSLMADPSNASLAELLAQSHNRCIVITEQLTAIPDASSETLLSAVNELISLIAQAQIQMSGRQSSAAFWQSCADAFTRTAHLLNSTALANAHDTQRLFEQTARQLTLQTSATIETGKG